MMGTLGGIGDSASLLSLYPAWLYMAKGTLWVFKISIPLNA